MTTSLTPSQYDGHCVLYAGRSYTAAGSYNRNEYENNVISYIVHYEN
jgi:hypothetical protein